MNRKIFWLMLLFMGLGPAFAYAAKTTYVYTDRKFHFVKRVELKKKELKDREEANHPYRFDELQLRNILADVHFSQKLILKKEVDAKEVFNKAALDFLVPHLVKAFEEAKPNEQVVFSFITGSAKLVFLENRLTLAEAWVKDNYLHIQFRKLMAKIDTTVYDKFADVSKAINRARGLRIDLELKPGQEFGDSVDEVLLPLTAATLAVPQTAQPQEEKTEAVVKKEEPVLQTEPVTTQPTSEVETRLRQLENLKKQGLVTKEEYEAKRKEILSNL